MRLDAEGYLCGGTLISSTHVLTAAHCVENKETRIDYHPSQIKVHLGEHNIDTTLGSDVAEVIKHSRYNSATLDNDYAILRLSKAVDFTSEVTPACLPADVESTYEGRIATATGWGRLGDPKTSKKSISLQEVNVTVKSNYECNKLYPLKSTSIMICAGGYGMGARSGDSGGPLIVIENYRHTLVIKLNNNFQDYLGSKCCVF